MILDNEVMVKWAFNNKSYYMSKGYVFTKIRDSFLVKIEDMMPTSSIKVKCQCDFCGEIFYRSFRSVSKQTKHCCKSKLCMNNLRKFTCLQKYGTDHISRVKEIIERRGHIKKSKLFPKCKHRARHDTVNKINSFIHGTINFKLNNSNIDIALIDEKIDIEYNGEEQAIIDKFGLDAKTEFEANQFIHDANIIYRQWKIIRIICVNEELLPSNKSLDDMINLAKQELKTKHVVVIDIDNDNILSYTINDFFPNDVTVERWGCKNKDHYNNKGYNFIKYQRPFFIKIQDMHPKSNAFIKFQCALCGEFDIKPHNIMTHADPPYVCRNPDCIKERKKLSYQNHYGVDHPFQSKEIQEKIKTQIHKHYGPLGLKHPSIQNKKRATCERRYGGPTPMSDPNVAQKVSQASKKTFSKMSPEKRKQIQIKAHKTMYMNKTGPASKNQKHIANLLNGELNYPFRQYQLDIFLPEENIVIEYDGGGHWLGVYIGKSTLKEAKQNQLIREKYIFGAGMKLIRIICTTDYKIFNDDKLLPLITLCKQYLLTTNHHWIHINVDKLCIESKELNLKLDEKGNIKEEN